jgi:hypothetical protein
VSTVAPPELNRLYQLIDPYLSSEARGGIVNPRSPGYHTSPEDLRAQGRTNDYSIQCPADRRGRPADATGVDITFRTLAELVLVHKRLRVACTPNAVGAYDPRIECLRECIGTLDGRVVSGYNRVATGTGTRSVVGWDAAGFGDDSHLWHEHLSILRDRARDANAIAGLAEVLCGLAPGTLGWKPAAGELPPPVVVVPDPLEEHPLPTSGELYLDKVAAGVKDSDTVAYVQVLLAQVLKITLRRTGDYDPATIAAARKFQAEVLGDAPKYCDGILGQLQLLELIDRAGSKVKLYRSSATGGLITKAATPPAPTPPTPRPKPAKATLRLKAWNGSPAGRTLIQGMFWDSVNRCWWIWQADTVAGRKQQTVVIRRHLADGTYVGYITLVDAGHGSSIGVEPFLGGARFWVGHATKGAGYVTYRIGDSSTTFTPTTKLPSGDITVSADDDLLCIRVKDRYRGYDLSDARQGTATLRWDVRVPDWMERFQGHLVVDDLLVIHRDVATKGASELRVYRIAGKGTKATATRLQTVDTNPYGDEAEGAMVKDGWLFSVSRTGGDNPNRTVDATPVREL